MKGKSFTLADNKFNWFHDYCFVGILSTDDPDIPDPAPADISHLDLANLTHRNKSASSPEPFERYSLDYSTKELISAFMTSIISASSRQTILDRETVTRISPDCLPSFNQTSVLFNITIVINFGIINKTKTL